MPGTGWKPRWLPETNDIMDRRKESVSITLLDQHNPLLHLKPYPYAHRQV